MTYLHNDKNAPKALIDAIELANEVGSIESQAKQNQSGEQYLAEIRQSNQTIESMATNLSSSWGWKGNDYSRQICVGWPLAGERGTRYACAVAGFRLIPMAATFKIAARKAASLFLAAFVL